MITQAPFSKRQSHKNEEHGTGCPGAEEGEGGGTACGYERAE